jgi:hypothetical protein
VAQGDQCKCSTDRHGDDPRKGQARVDGILRDEQERGRDQGCRRQHRILERAEPEHTLPRLPLREPDPLECGSVEGEPTALHEHSEAGGDEGCRTRTVQLGSALRSRDLPVREGVAQICNDLAGERDREPEAGGVQQLAPSRPRPARAMRFAFPVTMADNHRRGSSGRHPPASSHSSNDGSAKVCVRARQQHGDARRRSGHRAPDQATRLAAAPPEMSSERKAASSPTPPMKWDLRLRWKRSPST